MHRTEWYATQPQTETKMADEAKKVELRQTGIKVKLVGTDGNAWALIGRVSQALRRGGQSKEFIDAFVKEATSGDYNHLLCTCMEVCEVE